MDESDGFSWFLSWVLRQSGGCEVKTLYQQVGQLMLVGFAGCSVPSELRALAREWNLGEPCCLPGMLRNRNR